jgi:hypothetical protein
MSRNYLIKASKGDKDTETKREELFSLFDEKRKNGERGPIVFYFLKEILSHYGIPDSQHLCMLINWNELFPPRFEWDRDYCNQYVIFNLHKELILLHLLYHY